MQHRRAIVGDAYGDAVRSDLSRRRRPAEAAGRGSIAAPAGAPTSEYVSVFTGRSGSVADAVKLSAKSHSTDLAGIAARTGVRFTSLTVTVIASSSDSAGVPLSVTRTVKVYVPGPSVSVGVQLKAPSALIEAPAGSPTRLKVSVLAGRSGSLAVAVKVNAVSSSTVLLPIAFNVGALLTSLT